MAFESARGAGNQAPGAVPSRRNPDDAAANSNARAPLANLTLPGPKVELRFPVGGDARAFYRRFFPGTSQAEWNDWRWQMQVARIRSLEELSRIFLPVGVMNMPPSPATRARCRVGITPYYASLMGLTDAEEPAAPHPYHRRHGEYVRGPGGRR